MGRIFHKHFQTFREVFPLFFYFRNVPVCISKFIDKPGRCLNFKYLIVYYVPRQSSTYDTLSEMGKRKREFVCRGAAVQLRLIIPRTCICGIISHLYRNKLDVAERGEGGPGGEGPSERCGGQGPLDLLPPFCTFSAAHGGIIKCNFTAAPQARKERFFYLFQIK